MIKEKDVHIITANGSYLCCLFQMLSVSLTTEPRIIYLGAGNQRGTAVSLSTSVFVFICRKRSRVWEDTGAAGTSSLLGGACDSFLSSDIWTFLGNFGAHVSLRCLRQDSVYFLQTSGMVIQNLLSHSCPEEMQAEVLYLNSESEH